VAGALWRRAWWLAPVCLTGVLLLDTLLPHAPSYALLGAGDEMAHLLTSAIAVLALLTTRRGRVRTAFVAGALIAGNLIDVDHVPMVLGDDFLTEGTPRPYAHSLTFVLVLLVLGQLVRGSVAAALRGAACGVFAHLIRDLGTAPVALFWPVTNRGVDIPYFGYAVVLTAFASAAVVLGWRRERQGDIDRPPQGRRLATPSSEQRSSRGTSRG
jgi:hypothetical protein